MHPDSEQPAKAIRETANLLSRHGTASADGIVARLQAYASSSVGEHFLYCLHIDLTRGRLKETLLEKFVESISADDSEISPALMDSLASDFADASSPATNELDGLEYVAVWNLQKCVRTFVPPTRAAAAEAPQMEFSEYLRARGRKRFSAVYAPVASYGRPLGWVTAYEVGKIPDLNGAEKEAHDLIEVLGLPWPEGEYEVFLVKYPVAIATSGSLAVPTAFSVKWQSQGLFVSNNKDVPWGHTCSRTRGDANGMRERVHGRIEASQKPHGGYFEVVPMCLVQLPPFSHLLALEAARHRSQLALQASSQSA